MNIRYALSDTLVMTGRVMKQLLRSVDTVITVLLMPIMMLLAMRYVFGGAMDLGGIGTADYMLPGVILFCILSGISYTAFRLNFDVQKGIFERFHSMPVAKSSILGGHVLASLVSNIVSVAVLVLVGLVVGFQPGADMAGWAFAGVLVVLFTIAMTWISVFFGLMAKSAEASGVFSYLLIGLAFISSSFVPVGTMPPALAAFAQFQPMTPIVDSLRGLLLGSPVSGTYLVALMWCIVVGAAFWALSVKAYRQRMR
ncbi:MAG: ABC transporter permease [Coriobacteriaceae bacterium]|jgi:ABC-2 type transport system permease protein|nr:ABC transporter permease [Coriobacteriaceae bacterium]